MVQCCEAFDTIKCGDICWIKVYIALRGNEAKGGETLRLCLTVKDLQYVHLEMLDFFSFNKIMMCLCGCVFI